MTKSHTGEIRLTDITPLPPTSTLEVSRDRALRNHGRAGSSGGHGGAESSGGHGGPWPWPRHSARPPRPGLYSPPKKYLGGLTGDRNSLGLSTGTGTRSGLGSEAEALSGHDEGTQQLYNSPPWAGCGVRGPLRVTQELLPYHQQERQVA